MDCTCDGGWIPGRIHTALGEDGSKAAQHNLTEYLNLKKASGIVIIVGRSFVFREAFERALYTYEFWVEPPAGKAPRRSMTVFQVYNNGQQGTAPVAP
jgi:hypothetical protein